MSLFDELLEPWQTVQRNVTNAREKLRCTRSNAWFRGHCDTKWPLLPTLLRHGARDDTEDTSHINHLETLIVEKKIKLKQIYKQKTVRKKQNQQLIKQNNLIKIKEVSKEYHELKKAADQLENEIADIKINLLKLKAAVLAERDIFDEYVYRSSTHSSENSWHVLTDMRHHGIPTRLLDWTDRLDIALYFATRQISALIAHQIDPYDDDLSRIRASIPTEFPRPCIWILNPFFLAKRTVDRFSIIDITREAKLDYYSSFLIGKNWPYNNAIPIFPPNKSERVEFQRSFFTVHGNIKNSLENISGNETRVISKIEMTIDEAIACQYFIEYVNGLNEFEIFRDRDALGRLLYNKFLNAQKWNYGMQ